MRRFAISDIHGCAATFKILIEKTLKLQQTDKLYLLGDYIDRGPDSKGVFDYIWHLQEKGFSVQCIRGNHEQMMLDALENPDYYHVWYRNGGQETLDSFGVHSLSQIPFTYFDFMRSLDFYISLEDYLLVHAGFNFGNEDIFEDEQAMIWIRNWYHQIDLDVLGGKQIIHGHTPMDRPTIEALNKARNADETVISGITDNQEILDIIRQAKRTPIDIDAGCAYYNRPRRQLGHLCAFDLDAQTLYFEPYVG